MKNTMKLFWLLAAASVVLSCSKEAGQNLEATPGEEKTPAVITPATDGNLLTSFGVTFEGDVQDEETKVSVTLDTGVTEMEENDEVLVFVDGENNAIYKYDGEKFVLKGGETAVALGATASVYYPASEFEKTTAVFTMPAAIEASGDFGAINPMAGVISGGPGSYSVELGNIASILRVQVSADVNINSVSLNFGDGVTYAAGSTFSVDASSKAMTLVDPSAATTETVALGTPDTAADVLFILPTLVLSNGLTVTANLAANHNGGANSFSISKSSYKPDANKISSMSFYAGLFSGGAGTSVSPYLISKARDFKNFQKYTTGGYRDAEGFRAADFLAAHYKQTENITAGTVTPVGTSTAPFTGNYDGQGNTLNVTISTTTNNTGVFGYIQNATVKDLTVEGTIESSGVYTAGIAGQMAGSSKISGCTNKADITNNTNESNSYAAGIVGKAQNTSEIVSCVNEGAINASKAFAGGIVGDMTGTVDKCVNKNSVVGGANTGGIAGALRASSTVRRCYSSDNKTITGTNRVGGIVGSQVGGTVANCFSNSNVTITSNADDYGAGGLVGILGNGLLFNSSTGDITVKCSATCTDKDDAKVNVGGLVGRQNNGTIQNVYSPLYAKDIKIGTIHGRSSSGKIGQIVGVIASGNLCAYYFGGCATATTGWQYWGTNNSSNNTDGQWAFTSANNVSMDWTAPVAKGFSGFGQSLTSGNYHLKDVLNIDKSSSDKYSAYTPAEGEVITWSDLSASDFHAIPDALKVLGEDYYAN